MFTRKLFPSCHLTPHHFPKMHRLVWCTHSQQSPKLYVCPIMRLLLKYLSVEWQAGQFVKRSVQTMDTTLNITPSVESHCSSLEAQVAADTILQPLPYCPYLHFHKFGKGPNAAGLTTPTTPRSAQPPNNEATPSHSDLQLKVASMGVLPTTRCNFH